MIISASRRTDIPALFSDWFYNRVWERFVLLKNPYNPLQVGRLTLSPDKVDGIVFWTKNAAPMLPRIHELDTFKYYFQFTITPYGKDVERNIPDKREVVIPAFQKLAGRAIWRYDPIFINARYSRAYHVRAFAEIAEALEGSTDRVVTSFVDSYRTVDLSLLGIEPQTEDQKCELAQELSEIAKSHGMTLYSCAEELGLPPSCCIDGSMFGVKLPKDRNQRGACTCVESIDIGAYSTCGNGCVYCYANHYGYVMPRPDPKAELLGSPLTGKEKIKQRN